VEGILRQSAEDVKFFFFFFDFLLHLMKKRVYCETKMSLQEPLFVTDEASSQRSEKK